MRAAPSLAEDRLAVEIGKDREVTLAIIGGFGSAL
jgi:hypothetical protein